MRKGQQLKYHGPGKTFTKSPERALLVTTGSNVPEHIRAFTDGNDQRELFMVHMINSLLPDQEIVINFTTAFPDIDRHTAQKYYYQTKKKLNANAVNMDPQAARATLERYIMVGMRGALETRDFNSYMKLISAMKDLYGVATNKKVTYAAEPLSAKQLWGQDIAGTGTVVIDAEVEDPEKPDKE